MVTKLFKGLIATTLGLTMAVGVGVGVAMNKKESPAFAAPTAAFSFSRSGSADTVTNGYEMVITNAKTAADYYQDKNSTVGLDLGVKKSTGTIWSTTPVSISLTVKVGGGSTKDPLVNNVIANLIDADGNAINGTNATVTTKVETTTGKNYTISLPVANNVAGVMIHHEKESNYNSRVYEISLSYVEAGGEPIPETYSVTYENGGGSGSLPIDSNEYESGDEVTVLANINLVKDGFTFGGWSDGVTTYQGANTFNITGNTTLTAVWNPIEGVDVLDKAFTGISSNYGDWSAKQGAGSSAIYGGNSGGGNSSIQLRASDNSGLVSTKSGGNIRRITVDWNDGTAEGRTLDVYGKNTAYASSSDLYNVNKKGSLLGTIVKGTSTTLSIDDDYRYIGVCSHANAMYLNSIKFEWESCPSNPRIILEPSSLEIKTNQAEGATVTGLVEDVEGAFTYQWTANNSNVVLENASSATVTIKPADNLNANCSSRVTLTLGGVEPSVSNYIDVSISLPGPGETPATAYSVGKAIEEIDDNGDQQNVYVRGIISQIDSFSSQSITYWISDDGTTNNQFEVYKGKGLDGAAFSSVEDIETGATVVVYGNITKYNETYEFSSGSSLASYTGAPRYTVTFDSLGGSDIEPISNIKKGNSIATLPIPTKANDTQNKKRFEFEGWHTVQNPPFNNDNKFTSSTAVNDNITVYANYNEISYHVVSFNTNGGTNISNQNIDHNGFIVLPNDPIKAADSSYSYEFEGWYTNEGLTSAFDAAEPISSDLILYAKYTASAISNPGSYLNYGISTKTIHGHEISASGVLTASETINDLVVANNWNVSSGSANGLYTSFNLDSNINISTNGSPNCGSIWGTTTNDWRLYQAQSGDVVVSATNGYQLTAVTFTYSTNNGGILKDGQGNSISSGTEVTLSGSTVTFTVGNTGDKNSGQVRITAISVSYERAFSLTNVALRFGGSISKTNWDAVNDNLDHPEWDIEDYGVMLMKATDLTNGGYASVQAAFEASASSSVLKILNKCAGGAAYAEPYLEGENYIFQVNVNFPNNKNYYNDVIYAVPFIVVDGQYYFLQEMHTSIHDLATELYGHDYEYLSDTALAYLKTN